MEEKIYLGDWLYNAGIVGFLKIMEYNGVKDEIKFEDNCICFNKDILKDFQKYYFSFAYTKANTIFDKISQLKHLLSTESSEKDIKTYIINITTSKTMKRDDNISQILTKGKESNNWKTIAENLINVLPEHWEKNKDLYVKYYLQGFYESKSMFNPTITTNLQEKFKQDFIKPIFENKSNKKKTYCKICNERIAKKDTFFDEGVFKLSGASTKEYKNFYWNLIPNTHICIICELIFLCSFAGFSNLKSIGEYRKYLFVNMDTTVEDLYKINNTVENFILNSKENPFKVTIRNILLDYEAKRSKWTLGNILFIEFDTEKAPYRIQHFHIPKYIAELFTEKNYGNFQKLEGFYYKDDKENINVLTKTIDYIFESKSLYLLLNKVIRDFLSEKHKRISGLFNLVNIQNLLKIYKEGVIEVEKEVSKKLWVCYKQGEDIANTLRQKNAENKINGIAYKMLSSLRVKDTKSFYDTMLRLYINLGKEVPPIFLESLSPDSPLDSEAIGYAFLTGLLGKDFSKEQKTQEGGEEK